MIAFKKYLDAAHCFYACIAAEEGQRVAKSIKTRKRRLQAVLYC